MHIVHIAKSLELQTKQPSAHGTHPLLVGANPHWHKVQTTSATTEDACWLAQFYNALGTLLIITHELLVVIKT